MNHRPLPPLLIAATHNKGKLVELKDLFHPAGIALLSAADFNLLEPEETGASFLENAVIKARAAAQATGKAAVADDSGLCVEALDGQPGIFSARWASGGEFAPAMTRIAGDLKARGAPPPWRAWFVGVLAIMWPDGHLEAFEGRVDGTLVFPPRGALGFGYDPCFQPDGHTRTFGEMTREEKHGLPADGSRALSHRARAFQDLAQACITSYRHV